MYALIRSWLPRPQVLLLAALAGVFVVACARGGSGASGDDESPKVDAKTGGTADGPTTPIDAPKPPVDGPPQAVDAPPMVDAPPSLFCTANNQCTTPGQCCIDLGGPMGFCGPGTIILGECIPQ